MYEFYNFNLLDHPGVYMLAEEYEKRRTQDNEATSDTKKTKINGRNFFPFSFIGSNIYFFTHVVLFIYCVIVYAYVWYYL